MTARAWVGVDTGGTFTDFVLVRGRSVEQFKLPSTPGDPARAVLEGLALAEARLGRPVDRVVHGFTVATNALLTRRGARTALVLTAGFEDLLAVGRQDRPELYALAPAIPEPLVPPSRTLGVRERRGAGGRVVTKLTSAEIRRVCQALHRLRPEAVAVCLLHAYADPAHERTLVRALRRALPGVPVCASSEVAREYREFERTTTTVVNAFLTPVVRRYLGRLGGELRARLYVMQSNGGCAAPAAVSERPVLSVLSGPAGGVSGAAEVGRTCGAETVLSLDVGGTSTDVALVAGRPRTVKGATLDGHPLLVPFVEMETVGAGGGSLARIDRGGALLVGPESAGADPGPAAYGRGGGPTVTDAQLVLGRIVPGEFAGGELPLDAAAAWRALADLGSALRLSGRGEARARAAARGVVAVANASIERALRLVSVARGHDPRDAMLVAFGGAGGLFGAEVGRALGVRDVVVPLRAGVLSAWGLLGAEELHPLTRSVLVTADAANAAGVRAAWREMESEARRLWGRSLRLRRRADLRYVGQSFEIEVAWGRDLAGRFHAAHAARYGYARERAAVEIVSLNLEAYRPAPPRPAEPAAPRRQRVRGEPATIDDGRSSQHGRLYRRETLGAGFSSRGPALVVEYGATTYVPPGQTLTVDRGGHLRIR